MLVAFLLWWQNYLRRSTFKGERSILARSFRALRWWLLVSATLEPVARSRPMAETVWLDATVHGTVAGKWREKQEEPGVSISLSRMYPQWLFLPNIPPPPPIEPQAGEAKPSDHLSVRDTDYLNHCTSLMLQDGFPVKSFRAGPFVKGGQGPLSLASPLLSRRMLGLLWYLGSLSW